jgi:hypothetical protein
MVYGVQNLSAVNVDATYNSWGHVAGPVSGNAVSGPVTYAPFTFAEVFVDMEPDTLAVLVGVNEDDVFSVAVKVEAVNLYAVTYKLAYETDFLEFVSLTPGSEFETGAVCITNTATAGEISVVCTKLEPSDEITNVLGETVSTITFKAAGAGLAANGPWTTHLDLSVAEADLSTGAIGGVKVFVNNAGFGAPSSTPRDITDDARRPGEHHRAGELHRLYRPAGARQRQRRHPHRLQSANDQPVPRR